MTRSTSTRPIALSALTLLTAAAVAGLALPSATAAVEPGTPQRDVHIGLDDDNARNPLVQPPGVVAKQHMDDTDILFGRGDDDLLIGRLGSDTLLGGPGSDILVGGPEHGASPSSDVLVGDLGDDVAVWSPGDGNDAFVGNEGYDTMVVGSLATNADGSPKLAWSHNRQIPRVRVDHLSEISCTLVPVPATSQPGFEYLLRIAVNGVPTATVRQKDIEQVLCPSAERGSVRVASLTTAYPAFRTVSLAAVRGLPGAIVAPSA